MKKLFFPVIMAAAVQFAAAAAPEPELKAAANAFIDAYNNNTLVSYAYKSLPKTPYRNNIEKMRREFAASADKDIWDKATQLISSVVSIFGNKVFYSSDYGAELTGNSSTPESLAAKVRLFAPVVNAMSYDNMVNLSAERFAAILDKPVSGLIKEIGDEPQKYEKKTCTVNVAKDGKSANIGFHNIKTRIGFVKTDGKWLLENIAKIEYKDIWNAVSKILDPMKNISENKKSRVLMAMEMLVSPLKYAEAAKTAQEMNTAIEGALLPAMMLVSAFNPELMGCLPEEDAEKGSAGADGFMER